MTEYSYVGNELELFQHASNWKAYYGQALRPFIGGDVLEVGAGFGATSRFLCDGRQRSWTSLEPDRNLFARLTANLEGDALRCPCRAVFGTTASLPVHEIFDTILYIDVLEHIEDDRSELTMAAAHLRRGGRVVVLAPAHQHLYSSFDRSVGHYRRYSKQSLLAAAPCRLRPAATFYLDAVGMVASLANRWVLHAAMPTIKQIRFWDSTLIPLSRIVDRLTAYRLGKSVVAIWTISENES